MAIQRGKLALEHYRGDAYTIQLKIQNTDEYTGEVTPVDITNFDILWVIRPTADSEEEIIRPKIAKTDPENGIFQWHISKEISETIPVQNGVFDIQITTSPDDPDYTQVITIVTGTWKVIQDVSRDPTMQPSTMSIIQPPKHSPSIASAIMKCRKSRGV